MEKRKLKAIVLLLAAYVALSVGLAYAVPQITIASVTTDNAPDALGNPQALPGEIMVGASNVNVTVPTNQPLPDSASIVFYHVGYGFYKWADITLTYNTAPTVDVTWNVQIYVYEDTDNTGTLTLSDNLVSVSDQATITITAGQTTGTATVQLYPAVYYTQINLVELTLSPP